MPLRGAYGAHWSITGRGVPGARSTDAAVYLPGRNVILLSHAALAAVQHGVRRLAVGTLRGNPFNDASPRFFRSMSEALSQALGCPIGIDAPLRRLTKRALIRSAAGVPLALTFSCLRPRGRRPCGSCNKCAERRRAFRQAGVADATPYVKH